jgi:hypothetical protein
MKIYCPILNEIKKKIILEFWEALENALPKEQFGDEWEITKEYKEDVFSKSRGLHIAKKIWEKNYVIKLEAGKNGPKEFYIGLWRNRHKVTIRIDRGRLKKLLDEYIRGDGPDDSWEWYHYIHSDYKDWDGEDTLIRLYKKNEAVKYFKERIQRIAEIATPIIDEAVRSAKIR